MKWLIWANIDLENSLGGVEVHCRSVKRELAVLGEEVAWSWKEDDLNHWGFDVVVTHGSLTSWKALTLLKNRPSNIVWLHVLHGSTFDRMSAMGEWTWPGGYLAYGREMFATYYCDGLAAVYGEISFLDFLKRGNRPFSVIGNGWDSGAKKEVSKTEKRGHWAFVGRGLDPVKGVDLIEEIIGYDRSIRIDAIPGDGFTDNIQTRCLGKMSNEQVVEHLEKSKGLILPSYFEAMPLVILEALAFGIPVVAANVGGIRTLNSSLKGLFRLDIRDAKLWCEVINEASLQDQGQDRIERAMWNRRLLRTWNQVAQDMKSLCQAVLDQRRKTN